MIISKIKGVVKKSRLVSNMILAFFIVGSSGENKSSLSYITLLCNLYGYRVVKPYMYGIKTRKGALCIQRNA